MSRVLVYGGRGALGQSIVRLFNKKNWHTVSVDFTENNDATRSVIIPKDDSWSNQAQHVEENVKSESFDAVVCVAGGWTGGNIKSKELINSTDLMWKSSVQTAVLSAQIAAKYMKQGGLLVLPGAAGATTPTPGMIAYGVAKAAVHHLVRSLAQKGSGLPQESTVVGLMPVTLDTSMNRSGMPNANFDDWTPLDELSEKIVDWAQKQEGRPKSGSLIRVSTKDKVTSYTEE
jgi:dihydropteridine reductase